MNPLVQARSCHPSLSSSSSLDSDTGLGLEIKLRKLGKLVVDIANTDILPNDEELRGSIADDGAGESVVERFLIRICPILEEDIVAKIESLGKWRAINLARIMHIVRMKLMIDLSQMHLGVHPRVLIAVIEKGSLTEDPVLIKMWANYLVAACTFEQDDERYVSYARFLENITPSQANLLALLASSSADSDNPDTFKKQNFDRPTLEKLAKLAEVDELEDLHLDLSSLDALRLVDMQWRSDIEQAFVRITPLGVKLYKITHTDKTSAQVK